MKRILIYSTAYVPFVGGAEVAMKEITNRLSSGDFCFEMITAKMDRTLPSVEQIGNIRVHRVGIGHPMFDKYLLALFGHRKGIALHKEKSFDIVWSLMASYNGFAAEKFSSKTGVPLFLTLQEGDSIEYILHKVRFVRKSFNRIFSRASGLQAISTYLMDWGKNMGFSGKVVEVVPNGVDVARFTKEYSQEEIARVRASFGFSDDAVIVVTASRLVKKNGVADVIRALPLLPKEVCFVVCGSGELEASLKSLAKELRVSERVNFLGNQSHEQLPKILQASDLFIRPSLTEGLGNSFLEAMAAGLPTIGTPVGGIPDFLEDGKTGFICQPENLQSIADAIRRVMALSEEEKIQIHDAAMKMIVKNYNWTCVSDQMRAFFMNIAQ